MIDEKGYIEQLEKLVETQTKLIEILNIRIEKLEKINKDNQKEIVRLLDKIY